MIGGALAGPQKVVWADGPWEPSTGEHGRTIIINGKWLTWSRERDIEKYGSLTPLRIIHPRCVVPCRDGNGFSQNRDSPCYPPITDRFGIGIFCNGVGLGFLT